MDFNQRLKLLKAAIAGRQAWSVWTASGGLFLEIAREYRASCEPKAEIYLLCGRDAGERIVGWDYGEASSIAEQLREFQLVVAARHGDYTPPPGLAGRIHLIDLDEELQDVSSSRVRDAIADGRPWRGLVPAPVASLIESGRLYG